MNCIRLIIKLHKRNFIFLILIYIICFIFFTMKKQSEHLTNYSQYSEEEFDAAEVLLSRKWSHFPTLKSHKENHKEILNGKKSERNGNGSSNEFINAHRPTYGLTTDKKRFLLNGEEIQIRSGEIHYFRIHQSSWHNRLSLLKACNLNTVSTYIPWNLHEPSKGKFNFNGILNLTHFVSLADALGLHVILRPGPYICAEMDFGGLPAWLLKHDDMKVRTTNARFMEHVSDWFRQLFPMLAPLQYTKGGPVIAFQVENEYDDYPNFDDKYLFELKNLFIQGGICELLYVCADINGIKRGRNTAGMIRAVNLQDNVNSTLTHLARLHSQQKWHGALSDILLLPNGTWLHMPMFRVRYLGLTEGGCPSIHVEGQSRKPIFVAEFWSGWFDWWGGPHHMLGQPWKNTFTVEAMAQSLADLMRINASFNIYMFAGGTNFGFINGALMSGNQYLADTTSYDYDALVTEGGRITNKYKVVTSILQSRSRRLNVLVEETSLSCGSYPAISYMTLSDIMKLKADEMLSTPLPLNMERITNDAYGYIIYETKLNMSKYLHVEFQDSIRDRGLVYVDTLYQGEVNDKKTELRVNTDPMLKKHTLSVLVENQGRVNWVSHEQTSVMDNQRKGIVGNVYCNGKILVNWKSWPINFNTDFFKNLKNTTNDNIAAWKKITSDEILRAPILLKFIVELTSPSSSNSYIQLRKFGKGVVILNGFVLGRYWNSMAPQKTLFVPWGLLKQGFNEFLVFEEITIGTEITLEGSETWT